MNIRPAGDGWRVITDCGGGCGAPVVCLPAAIGTALCITCGRAKHGAAVPQRPVPGETRRNGLPLGQPGTSLPAARPMVEVMTSTSGPAIRKGLIEEWPLDDVRLPAGARGFIADLARAGVMSARVCHTVALGATGQLIETVGVHWRGNAAFWTKHDTPRVRHEASRKVDLTRTATGRRRVLRFDPKVWWTGGVTWTGEVYAPMRMTVTQAILAIRARMGT